MGNMVVVLDGIFGIMVMSCFGVVLITNRAQYLAVDVKTRIGPTSRSVAAVEPHNVSTLTWLWPRTGTTCVVLGNSEYPNGFNMIFVVNVMSY